jgi:hypothetical protein
MGDVVVALDEIVERAEKEVRKRPKVLPAESRYIDVVLVPVASQRGVLAADKVYGVVVAGRGVFEQVLDDAIRARERRQGLDPKDRNAESGSSVLDDHRLKNSPTCV